MFIYKITNKANGKVYIGKTKLQIEERFKRHINCAKNKVNRYLYDAMNHYGYENFDLCLVEECENESVLSERERFWIKEYRSQSPEGYNMTEGGDGGNTLQNWSDEDKIKLWEKQARSRTGLRRSDQTRRNMSDAAKIRESSVSESKRENISDKISSTLKQKYALGQLKANTPKLYGESHPQYLNVDIETVLKLIYNCHTLKQISKMLNTSTYGIRSRLIEKTGKNYLEWRKEYGIVGPLSKPCRIN